MILILLWFSSPPIRTIHGETLRAKTPPRTADGFISYNVRRRELGFFKKSKRRYPETLNYHKTRHVRIRSSNVANIIHPSVAYELGGRDGGGQIQNSL